MNRLLTIIGIIVAVALTGRLAIGQMEQPVDFVNPPQAFMPLQSQSMTLDTLDIKDMDINDCLKLLASKTGMNIIAGKSITGRVTIFLQNVQVYDALTIILKANDLAYIEDRGVVQILPAAEYEQLTGHKFGVETESAVINLKSAKAAYVLSLLTQVKSSVGKIIADEQTNSLIIEEVPQRMKVLRDYIKQIDVPTITKVYELKYISAEAVVSKLQDMATPKIGTVTVNGPSNKLFIRDTKEKINEMVEYISHIDIARQTKVFKISYAKAEDLAKTITPMLTKDLGSIQFDPRPNTIVVNDIGPVIEEIGAVIAALDKNDKEVLIEAKIVQITLSDDYQMGINWETILPNSDHTVVNLQNDFSLAGTVNPVSVATIGTLDRDKYTAVIQMISSLGKSRLLSNPRIAVVNNQEAKILVGTTTPYVTNSTTTPATGPTTTAESVNFIDTGVKLYVTPTIHDDGYISIKIKPEISNIPSSITTSVNNQIPVVDTSKVETMIRVKDGVTIIIGGLIKEDLRNTQNKIPVLGDLPLIGKAFRNESRSMDKSEIVIFLTPHIISGDVHVDTETYNYPTIYNNDTYYNPLPKDQSTSPVP